MKTQVIACTMLPLAGAVVAETADSTPWIAGFAVIVMTALVVPLVRSMMHRLDTQAQQAAAAAERREKREDERHEAFQQLVQTLGSITLELRSLNEHHREMDRSRIQAVKEIIEKIDDLPDRIVRKCNG